MSGEGQFEWYGAGKDRQRWCLIGVWYYLIMGRLIEPVRWWNHRQYAKEQTGRSPSPPPRQPPAGQDAQRSADLAWQAQRRQWVTRPAEHKFPPEGDASVVNAPYPSATRTPNGFAARSTASFPLASLSYG